MLILIRFQTRFPTIASMPKEESTITNIRTLLVHAETLQYRVQEIVRRL